MSEEQVLHCVVVLANVVSIVSLAISWENFSSITRLEKELSLLNQAQKDD